MIKEIVTDKQKLSIGCMSVKKSERLVDSYWPCVNDLLDTAREHNYECAGLAANQIGYNKRIFVVKIGNTFIPMVNPVINLHGKMVKKNESCLSFPGKVFLKKRRYYKVKVSYFDPMNQVQVGCLKLKKEEARAIQHEMDHLNGKLI